MAGEVGSTGQARTGLGWDEALVLQPQAGGCGSWGEEGRGCMQCSAWTSLATVVHAGPLGIIELVSLEGGHRGGGCRQTPGTVVRTNVVGAVRFLCGCTKHWWVGLRRAALMKAGSSVDIPEVHWEACDMAAEVGRHACCILTREEGWKISLGMLD